VKRKFVVEVPCTIIDRYFVFAESHEHARKLMESGVMREQTDGEFGDYIYDETTDADPVTHWHRADIVDVQEVVF
jgi:hypothetical protein